jgi:excinuclease ABC subunit C
MYEKAKLLRNQIASLQVLNEKQTVEKEKSYDEDIINYIISDDKVYLILFNIVKGTLASKREFSFDYEDGFLDEFIVQYYSENKVPKQIIVPSMLNDESIKNYLENIRKGSVTIIVPEKGDKKQLLDLVQRNIEVSFFAESEMTNALRNELNLNSNPNVIECFDISNISGTSSVGSMVQFRGAKPDKSNYRRFKIKTVVGSDDFASIAEIVKRRYFRLKEENAPMPDLIVIDGGLGQLNAALGALGELELKIPIISLAKKFEEIYLPGRTFPIRLKKDSKALKLLIQIRDEAHRFAINYHRLLRSKEMIK